MPTQALDESADTATVLGAATKRRRRRRWVVVMAMVLPVLAGTAYLVAASTQRLEFGGFYGYNPADGVSMRQAGRTTELRFAFRPNDTFVFYTSIRNPGPWTVEVDDVFVPGPGYAVETLRYSYDGDGRGTHSYLPEHASAWRPVSVAPDAVLALFLTVSIPDVEMAPGSYHYWEDLSVRYRVLGLAQARQVPIGFFLSVGPDS
ncbi:MAG TPA: hypothetical protein VF062_28305 [Candidatus Limnocylindrales bacterium]